MKSLLRLLLLFAVIILVCEASAQRKPSPEVDRATSLTTSLPSLDGPSSTLLFEDFSSASGTTPPAGWTNNTILGSVADVWHFDNPANRSVAINNAPPAAVFDSDFLSCDGSPEIVALESPAFNAPLNSNIVLSFRQYFRSNNVAGLGAIVDVFNGVEWVMVDSMKYSTTDPATATIDITKQAAGVSNARIRFRFRGNCSWYWYVDDISVTETSIAPSTRLLVETFKNASGSIPPSGWTNNRMVGQPYDEWRFDNPSNRHIALPMTGRAAIFDSDSLSRLGGAEDVALESPAFSPAANSTVQLTVDHFFRGDSGGRGTVEVFNGTSWISVWDSTKSTPNPQLLTLDISNHVAGVSNAKVRFRWRGWWSWWWIIDNVVITETPGATPSGIVSDMFNDHALNTAVWTFVNPKGDATLSMTGSQLSISVPAGSSHDITEVGNLAPRIMQDVSNPQNFELYVKFDGLMNQAYQTQGVQVWQDSLNFLRLEFYGDGTNINRLAWDFVNGLHQDQGSAGLGIASTAPLYMKVTRQGDNWSQSWSVDGNTFTLGTTFTRALNVIKLGVYAGNVGFPESSTPAFTGLIDYFMTYNPLPVQIGSFHGQITASGNVQLHWTTVSETNNFGFEVQKSNNATSGFATCPSSFIPGNGTTLEPHSYAWIDPQTTSGRWFYRLKQIDLDQTVNYTEPVQVDVLTGANEVMPNVFALQQNYPNPFNPSTTIRFSVENNGPAVLEVYNTLGQKVETLFSNNAEPGRSYSVTFGRSHASGVYYYRLTSGSQSEMKRMILLK